MNNQDKIIFTWNQFWHYCEEITTQIINSKKEYSQIVVILRGGFYLGDYLSRRLKIPLSAIATKSYNDDNRQNELLIGELSYINPLKGRILLVDDLLDTGVTMKAVKDKLREKWNVKVDTAVVWQKFHSQCNSNYLYSFIPSHVWIVQPFETKSVHSE